MSAVYRISAGASIHIEQWSDWTDFDARPPRPISAPADLAYAFGDRTSFSDIGGDCFEIQRLRVNNGLSSEARRLVEEDFPLWEAAGARVIGGFEVVHGHDLPALLVILGWRSSEDAVRAQREVEADAGSVERRRKQRLASNQPAIRGSSRILGCTLSLSALS